MPSYSQVTSLRRPSRPAHRWNRLLLACGLFLTDGYLSQHPDYGPLMVALALAMRASCTREVTPSFQKMSRR